MKTLTSAQAKQIVSEMKAKFPQYSVQEICACLEIEEAYLVTKSLVDADL